MNNPGVMTVETGLGPESTGIPTYSLHIGGKPAFVASLFTDNSGENAHRMAACWNACARLDFDLLDRFGLGTATGSAICRLREQNAELIDLLKEALSVCASVSISQDRKVVVDGCISYRQTEEWCKWLEQEVQPKIRAAIAKATGEPQ
jgi:hypothetical protein